MEKIKVYYASDPICSHCWALEPHINQFFIQYGRYFDRTYLMGAIMPSWQDFPGDKRNGIFKPSDTTPHWRELAQETGMPIDGTLMQTDDYVRSSYPAGQVFIALRDQDEAGAMTFLRKIREALFVFNENISDPDILKQYTDPDIVDQALTPEYQEKLEADRQKMLDLGVFVTPGLIMEKESGQKKRMVGMKTADDYAKALMDFLGQDSLLKTPMPDLKTYLQEQDHLFLKEIEVMWDLRPDQVDHFIRDSLAGESYGLEGIQDTAYVYLKD